MYKLLSVFLTLGFLLLSVTMVSATASSGLSGAMGKLDKVNTNTGLNKNLDVTLGAVIKGALSLVGTVFLILMVYAGILWMTARGEDSQIDKASNIIKASIIGLFITMSAYAITFYITARLAV